MRFLTVFLLAMVLLSLSGCAYERASRSFESQTGAPAAEPMVGNEKQEASMKTVSLDDANSSQTTAAAFDRKIIRNADLTLEIAAPAEGQRRITSIAESRGGFVVTSDARQRDGGDGSKPEMIVTIVVRIPAAQFGAVIDEIRAVGSRVRQEKITGQDVTEEYIDLEARIRTKKALEAQFLEIMKQAQKVADALEVQRQIAEVRTEIERLEGRRRFLESQSSLSTITVTLQPPAPLVSTTGFFHSVRSAFGDGVDVAAGITLGIIRLVIALIPVVLLIILPFILLLRFLMRRFRRLQLARKLAQEP